MDMFLLTLFGILSALSLVIAIMAGQYAQQTQLIRANVFGWFIYVEGSLCHERNMKVSNMETGLFLFRLVGSILPICLFAFSIMVHHLILGNSIGLGCAISEGVMLILQMLALSSYCRDDQISDTDIARHVWKNGKDAVLLTIDDQTTKIRSTIFTLSVFCAGQSDNWVPDNKNPRNIRRGLLTHYLRYSDIVSWTIELPERNSMAGGMMQFLIFAANCIWQPLLAAILTIVWMVGYPLYVIVWGGWSDYDHLRLLYDMRRRVANAKTTEETCPGT